MLLSSQLNFFISFQNGTTVLFLSTEFVIYIIKSSLFYCLHAANIREISEIAKGFLVFNIVPQISQMNTDFFLELGGWGKVTQIAQMTQIFHATELRLVVTWQKTLFWLFLQIFLYPRL